MSSAHVSGRERVAKLMEELARELRNVDGYSRDALPLIRGAEAECSSAHKRDKEKSKMIASPAAMSPALMTRTEVAELFRIDLRTLDRWRADPRMKFPEPIRRARVIRWRRAQIDRWIEAKTP